jgi:hypothetical protein
MYIQIVFLCLSDDEVAREYIKEYPEHLDSLTGNVIHIIVPSQCLNGDSDAVREALATGRFGALSLTDLPAMYVETKTGAAFQVCFGEDRETLKTVIRHMTVMASTGTPFELWEKEISGMLPKAGTAHTYVINLGRTTVGDTYNIGNAGAVGPNSSANNVAINNVGSGHLPHVDSNVLREQLGQLRAEMLKAAKDGSDYEAIAAVVKAEEAVKKGETSSALASLRTSGKWALDIAIKIGLSVAAKAIEGKIGI